jgi:hypothetical protein
MPQTKVRLTPTSREIKKNGQVVGITDRIYDLSPGTAHFDEILVTGELDGELSYNDHKIQIVRINTAIGMKVDNRGARGPVWEGVEVQVVN